MKTTVKNRVQKHRSKMKAAGFRPIQIWIPDSRRKGFNEELKRQVLLVINADKKDEVLMDFLDTAFDEIEGKW